MVHLGRSRRGRAGLSCWCDRIAGSCDCANGLRVLVLAKNEATSHHHMRRIASLLLVTTLVAAQQALACPFCYGAKDGKSTEHMAVAIWFLFGAVMSVIGGVGGFSFFFLRPCPLP